VSAKVVTCGVSWFSPFADLSVSSPPMGNHQSTSVQLDTCTKEGCTYVQVQRLGRIGQPRLVRAGFRACCVSIR
jgi:hypothetical protein